jgi:hypothetical protein
MYIQLLTKSKQEEEEEEEEEEEGEEGDTRKVRLEDEARELSYPF